jgi:hypothetical protein
VVFDIKTESMLRYVERGVFGPGYGVAPTPDKKRLYIPLGVPAQSAVPVVDAKTLTIPISSALKLASRFRSRSQARSSALNSASVTPSRISRNTAEGGENARRPVS